MSSTAKRTFGEVSVSLPSGLNVVCVGLLALTVACRGGDLADQGHPEPDTAGAAMICHTAAEPTVTIGDSEAVSNVWFGSVADARLTPRGWLLVSDTSRSLIHIFDGEHRWVRSVGGSGDGPGEFRDLQQVRIVGDSIIGFDRRGSHFSIFHLSGELLGTVRGASVPSSLPELVEVLDDRTVLYVARRTSSGSGVQLVRDQVEVLHFTLDGTLLRSLGTFPGREIYRGLDDGFLVLALRPFGRNASVAAFEYGVVVGTGDSPTLRVLPLGDEPPEELPVPDLSAPVTADFRSAYPSEFEYPERTAPYTSVHVDRLQMLWLGAYPDQEDQRYVVVSPRGRVIEEVRFRNPMVGFAEQVASGGPSSFLDADANWVVARSSTVLGVPVVELYPRRCVRSVGE